MSDDLFQWRAQHSLQQQAPLAERMRPKTLDEFVGQEHILGRGRLLRRAIEADRLTSILLHGPPGTGKTTLARIIAHTTQAHFTSLNAVLAGVKQLREAIETARQQLGLYGQRTILFVDEVHRFNKAQQDALLPWVENGTVTFIGATTENPYFEVNKALVSRSRVFQLLSLTTNDLRNLATRTLRDPLRGYGMDNVTIDDDALEHLVDTASGDARTLLNALELAVTTTPKNEHNTTHITLTVAEESIQRRAVLYDKEGDAHFDTISAFIKSLRGSDPDASLYWLAKMLYAGENPRFIFRRLIIFASEDIGLASSQALQTAIACAQAFDRVGLPEGRYHLSHATLALATAPKSNSTMGIFEALRTVQNERHDDVPNHLKDTSRDAEQAGHGKGYLYPHSFREHWVPQQYLPSSLQGRAFYTPSNQGHEATIATRIYQQREAQLAAFDASDPFLNHAHLTHSPHDHTTHAWLQRTLSNAGTRMAQLRTHIFEHAHIKRHHVALDLHARTGLLTWEAVRQTPEGLTIANTFTPQSAHALREQANLLPELNQPHILTSTLDQLPETLHSLNLSPDRILGINTLTHSTSKHHALLHILKLHNPNTLTILAEIIPQHTQRISAWLTTKHLPTPQLQRIQEAENTLFQDPNDPSFNWNETSLQTTLNSLPCSSSLSLFSTTAHLHLSKDLLDRWLSPSNTQTPSYTDRLSKLLPPTDLQAFAHVLRTHFVKTTVPWATTHAILRLNHTPQREITTVDATDPRP